MVRTQRRMVLPPPDVVFRASGSGFKTEGLGIGAQGSARKLDVRPRGDGEEEDEEEEGGTNPPTAYEPDWRAHNLCNWKRNQDLCCVCALPTGTPHGAVV